MFIFLFWKKKKIKANSQNKPRRRRRRILTYFSKSNKITEFLFYILCMCIISKLSKVLAYLKRGSFFENNPQNTQGILSIT